MRLSRALSEAEQRVLLRCAVGASGGRSSDFRCCRGVVMVHEQRVVPWDCSWAARAMWCAVVSSAHRFQVEIPQATYFTNCKSIIIRAPQLVNP